MNNIKEIDLKLPVNYSEEVILNEIERETGRKCERYAISRKSLDARKKPNVFWQLRVVLFQNELNEQDIFPEISVPKIKTKKKIVIVGCGPAGMFAALVLLESGFEVTLLERGNKVDLRTKDIERFESSGQLNEESNYAFGEGGAGTFSDGKLTSRTKTIDLERNYIVRNFIECGSPTEIRYLSKPHIGSDNLSITVKNIRKKILSFGGKIVFSEKVTSIENSNGVIRNISSMNGDYDANYFIFATGNSSYDTYRMLMDKGIRFRVKPFALGMRVEHDQADINKSQWGVDFMPGLKAAEYALTYKSDHDLPVFSFCMCPGGKIIPASSKKGTNIVNGVSNYLRDSRYANSAVVAAVDLEKMFGISSPCTALNWVEDIERRAYLSTGSYLAPFCGIEDFINGNVSKRMIETSYPFGVNPFDYSMLFPVKIISSIKNALIDFNRKIKNFNRGNLIGVETKTSSPVQVVRGNGRVADGTENFFMIGEGSGFAGGIISSAADGIKTALEIIEKER